MTNTVKYIPDGYHSITPYLIVKNAAKALDFYKTVFGSKEVMRMADPNGNIKHSEITIGNSKIMLADESPEVNALSPQTVGGSPVLIHLYVENVDKCIQRAVDNGSKLTRPIQDQFYGDRIGCITDPFGHIWGIATHTKDVSPEEMNKHFEEMKKHKVKQ